MALTLSLLGETKISLDGNLVNELCGVKAQALLFYLAVESDRAHRRDTLAEMFWPEKPPGFGRNNLKQTLSQLKKNLGDRELAEPYLISSKRELQFNTQNSHRVDALEFEDLLKQTKIHNHAKLLDCGTCLELLTQAAKLYQDEFLADYYLPESPDYNEWILSKREYYRRLMVYALENLIDCHEKKGEYSRAARYAKDLVELEPWSEGSHRKLMGLLAASGRRGVALRQYQSCKSMLKDEFDAQPGAETTALFERIKSGELSKSPQSFSPTLPYEAESDIQSTSPAAILEKPLNRWIKLTALVSTLILAIILYAVFFDDRPLSLPINQPVAQNEITDNTTGDNQPGQTNTEAENPSPGSGSESIPSAKPLADPDQVCLESEELLYLEDFQDGQAQGWPEIEFRAQNWDIVPDPGNPANFVVQNPGKPETLLFYQGEIFQDAVFRVQFLSTGITQPIFLWHSNNEPYQEDRGVVTSSDYSIGFMDHGTHFVRFTYPLPEVALLDGEFWLTTDVWHHLEISTYQGMLKVWLDGGEMLSYQDPAPLPAGTIGIGLGPSKGEDALAFFDDLRVCGLSEPFTSTYSK